MNVYRTNNRLNTHLLGNTATNPVMIDGFWVETRSLRRDGTSSITVRAADGREVYRLTSEGLPREGAHYMWDNQNPWRPHASEYWEVCGGRVPLASYCDVLYVGEAEEDYILWADLSALPTFLFVWRDVATGHAFTRINSLIWEVMRSPLRRYYRPAEYFDYGRIYRLREGGAAPLYRNR